MVAWLRDRLQGPWPDHWYRGHRHRAEDSPPNPPPGFCGRGRWRKLKGRALVELPDGSVVWAELHWYEAHGVGRVDMRVKRLLE
jgi:hypothetical protein